MKASVIGTVKDGVFSGNRKALSNILKQYEGKRVQITITKAKKERSNQQNRHYWGVVIPILMSALKDLGNIYTAEQMHDILKYKFLKSDKHIKDGEFITEIKSTTELSTTEFMDYIADIQQWSADFFGVEIPNPNQELTLGL